MLGVKNLSFVVCLGLDIFYVHHRGYLEKDAIEYF
jgi:hypothetical protein